MRRIITTWYLPNLVICLNNLETFEPKILLLGKNTELHFQKLKFLINCLRSSTIQLDPRYAPDFFRYKNFRHQSGFEATTSCLPGRRTTNWAMVTKTSRYLNEVINGRLDRIRQKNATQMMILFPHTKNCGLEKSNLSNFP